MDMSMGFSFGLEPRLEQKLQLKLTVENLFTIPFEVLCRRAKSNTTCPSCFHHLTIPQVKRGFRDDPFEISTKCPACKYRFVVNMKILLSDLGSVNFAWLCPRQLAQNVYEVLKGKKLTKGGLKNKYNLIINIAKNFANWPEFKKYYLSVAF